MLKIDRSLYILESAEENIYTTILHPCVVCSQPSRHIVYSDFVQYKDNLGSLNALFYATYLAAKEKHYPHLLTPTDAIFANANEYSKSASLFCSFDCIDKYIEENQSDIVIKMALMDSYD